MPKTPFQEAYLSLNQNQKKAVDTIDGPVMVMAGPGTGKTQVLTVRIANILAKTDVDPSAILALTFTEAAAKEMRQRLIGLIGQAGFSVRITTFHSFCADIIAENPERFSRPAGSQVATELEKIDIITKILEDGEFKLLKPINNPTLYLKNIIGSVSDLKREGITLKKFAQIINNLSKDFEENGPSLKKTAFAEQEKLINKNLDLLAIYQKYQSEINLRGRFDFEDMINWVVEAFEDDEEFLLAYQEKLQYILVDEYQDTNSAQNRLIFILSSFWAEKANIFVVGDTNQSIFRFQGASQENVNQFAKKFPKAVKITLTENYRSTKTILSTAARLIKETPLNHNADHTTTTIKVAKFSSSLFEDEFILSSIQAKINSGTDPDDIAIIVKENKDIDHLSDLLKQRNIPYRLAGGANILTTPLIGQFIKIMRVVVGLPGPLDDLDLFTILNYPYLDLDPIKILKLSRESYQNKLSLVDSIQNSSDLGIKSFFNRLVAWENKSASKTLPEIFQLILQESGLLNFILNSAQPVLELNRFVTLYEDAKKQTAANHRLDLASYVKNLTVMEDHGIKLEEESLSGSIPSVTLTTVHKSKGLEWLIVYIYRFADTQWGNKTSRQMIKLPDGILNSDLTLQDKNDEERRLFYVALTRAKRELYLSGSTDYSTSAKMVFPAMFLSELPPEHLELLASEDLEKNISSILIKQLSTPEPSTLYTDEIDFLTQIIRDFKLSPTALNTYLECHYKFKLDNLYHIPRAKAPAMCFGTAVHYALENLYRKLNQTGKLEKRTEFVKDFTSALDREILTKPEYQVRLKHGQEILSSYFDHYREDFVPALYTEKKFGVKTPILLDEIALTGKADRIDIQNTKDKTVIFTDYKTGAPKTRGMLEKDSTGSDGNYKRQLVFYYLLAGLDKSFDYKVGETILDFIEPDKNGHFHREHFTISATEVEELKKTIKQISSSIRALNFDRTTDTSICGHCDFKSHCWPNGIPPKVGDD